MISLIYINFPSRLGRAYGESGDDEKSTHHFHEANSIYKLTPGVKHPFYVEDFQPLFAKYVPQKHLETLVMMKRLLSTSRRQTVSTNILQGSSILSM